MARKAITFATVRSIALSLPGVEPGTAYGSPAVKVHGKMFACMASHKSAEPNTLAIRMSFDERDELMAADPDTYYLKEHYVDYPVVLVRLSRVHPDALRDLLTIGWRFASASVKRPLSKRAVKRRGHPVA